MDKKYKLILVEDDSSLGYLLSEYLGMKNFNVVWAKTAEEAIVKTKSNAFDLAILDVMLPDMDGFELSQKIKGINPELPFLFLTARSLKIDVLKGFSLGAVDYLKKPIDEEELVVRINALLSRLSTSEEEEEHASEYYMGDYTLNMDNFELRYKNELIKLTGKEFDLLALLAKNQNQLCTHKEILTTIWDKNDYFNKKSLNVFVSHLRKHLAKDKRLSIVNVNRRGFMLRVEE
ncbi:response regulator transcription factor [Flagellimonas zhangzhouensis]|uniref:DNA-binding response regulator, OmpR family, contains REC and winged-helix (WHTH) domain n=1 Tax=Flagellimonas zhangzhouensis TaxID=1073328 RepID=A0A1H2T0T4_9FLAO|nr:response regulator transcription factor [Allomuricauda zhangzhouensis]SDQ82338.1 DNA-binding response regulator, OmpR family, contains REC and winged-helix (wHTH) domain [Allomuricauda zhangzhouensis]SDW37573.1 DNA-binding response regulator, OmpR family, contains REC and winged-helix (wHTH) domain [Allomuricauda zhangzhouensis]